MLKETAMSNLLGDEIKRWTAALVLDIVKGKSTVSNASHPL